MHITVRVDFCKKAQIRGFSGVRIAPEMVQSNFAREVGAISCDLNLDGIGWKQKTGASWRTLRQGRRVRRPFNHSREKSESGWGNLVRRFGRGCKKNFRSNPSPSNVFG